MKFKRDYKITIQADVHDEEFWSATHKGENFNPTKEDLKVIADMLGKVKSRIERSLSSVG